MVCFLRLKTKKTEVRPTSQVSEIDPPLNNSTNCPDGDLKGDGGLPFLVYFLIFISK